MKKNLLSLVFLFFCVASHAQEDSARFYKTADGKKIYYEIHGRGFPVVLVHGFIVHGDNWKRTVLYTQLQQAGYQLIIPDLRGNGRSDKPHDAAAYENDAQARDIMGLVSELGIKQYHLAGYSRGSIIAARLLVLDKRVVKAILGGMGSEFTNPEWPRRILFYHALMGENVPELKSMVEYVQKAGLDQLALAYQQKEQPSTSREALAKIKRPVCVICGDKDKDNGLGIELAALIPGAVFKEVPGDHGHALATPEFAAVVLDFLRK